MTDTGGERGMKVLIVGSGGRAVSYTHLDVYKRQGIYAMFTNLFGNVLIFMPFGFFMPMASRHRSFFSALFYSFGLSLCVETFQLVTKVGSFDVDDLLLNTIGGVLGYMIFAICAAARRRYDHKKKAKRQRRR